MHLSGTLEVLLEGTHELLLLGGGLVGTVTELGGRVDPLVSRISAGVVA